MYVISFIVCYNNPLIILLGIAMNHKLTSDQFDKLFSPNTTVDEFKELKKLVSNRFSYIITQMSDIIGRNYSWYDFDNEGGDEYSPGSFDPQDYAQEVGIIAPYQATKNLNFDQYQEHFPTSWLKDDFEESLKQEVAAFAIQEAKEKTEQKEKAQNTFNKNTVLAAQIMAKLTEEEKAFVVSPSFAHFQEQQRQEFHKKAKAEKLAEKARIAQFHIERKKSLKK